MNRKVVYVQVIKVFVLEFILMNLYLSIVWMIVLIIKVVYKDYYRRCLNFFKKELIYNCIWINF